MIILEFIIRKAQKKDINLLIGLLTELFSIETDFIIDTQKQRDGLELIFKETKKACIMVAECEGKVVGMCSCQLVVSTSEGGFKGLIEDVVINKSYRGQSIGSELLEEITAWAISLGAKRIDLVADKRNKQAIDFYKKHGMEVTNMIALQKHV